MKSIIKNNRKIIFKTVLCWAGIGVFILILYFFFKSKNTVLSKSNNSKDLALLEFVGKKDSDGDGLMDWQELLLKTNPQNIDTNKNGINDKEEFLSETSKLENSVDVTTIKTIAKDIGDTSNSTVYFAKQLAKQMTGSNFNPKKISPQDILKNFSSKDISELSSFGLNYEPAKFTENDFKKKVSTKENVLTYFKELDKIIEQGKSEDEEILKRAITTRDFSEIKIIISGYQKNINDLKGIIVPDTFLSLHLELSNILSSIRFGLESFIVLETDPAKAYLGLEVYRRAIDIGSSFPQKLIDQLVKLYPPK